MVCWSLHRLGDRFESRAQSRNYFEFAILQLLEFGLQCLRNGFSLLANDLDFEMPLKDTLRSKMAWKRTPLLLSLQLAVRSHKIARREEGPREAKTGTTNMKQTH